MAEEKKLSGPDFAEGVSLSEFADGGMVQGHANGEAILVARRGDAYFAIGASCTHYGGPLAEGLIADDTVRCPWHHACFSLRTGEALRAPALDPVTGWRVEREGDRVLVRGKCPQPVPKPGSGPRDSRGLPPSVVIVGGGGAGLAAADMLRREGYDGALTMISADDSAPYDRPNLSKDFLAGTAPDDWIPLRSPKYYVDQRIDLVLGSRVSSLDVQPRSVQLENGKTYEFGALLMATGAEPVRLQIEGATDVRIHYLRTFADSKAIVRKAISSKRIVVVGASFIGLELAASLRARGIEVHVVAPESQPLERVMGKEGGLFIRRLHEARGVVFHLGDTARRIAGPAVTLSSGTIVDSDLVVLGVGVRPAVALAERAGLTIDRGISVNQYLETSAPAVFAAASVAGC